MHGRRRIARVSSALTKAQAIVVQRDYPMTSADSQPASTRAELSSAPLALWSIVAAFGTYFCMYAFRKPFTAAAFADSAAWGIGEKTLLVTAQVLGYTASKFIGIRVIAETPPQRRAAMILTLIGAAEAALILFGTVPPRLRTLCMLANGLSLGLVFGLVLGFLEGRRVTEALIAALCASFILADGVMKSVGTWLLRQDVSERWMPALAGLMFTLPLCAFVGMLAKIPPPDLQDLAFRNERHVMTRADRARLVRRHGAGMFLLVAAYFLVTVARSMRATSRPRSGAAWASTPCPLLSRTPKPWSRSSFWSRMASPCSSSTIGEHSSRLFWLR